MTEITVSGAAERRLPADRAMLLVSETFTSPEREAAYTHAAAAHARIVDRASRLVTEGEAERYAADPIATFSNSWRDERGETVVEHRATVNVTIELLALDRVGELTAELSIGGANPQVSWELSAEVRDAALRELRGEAVAAARAAAEDYAAALAAGAGRGGGSAVEIVSLRDTPGGFSPLPRAGVRFAKADAMQAPEVTVGEIAVRADVEAVFVTR